MKVAGIEYEVPWDDFKPGGSIFVPCLDEAEARDEVNTFTKEKGVRVLTAVRIEHGIKGLRIWRM